MQHRWPKQAMEIDDVFPDEVIYLRLGVRVLDGIEIDPIRITPFLVGCQVPDRGIEPDVKVHAWMIRNFETKVGCIAGDIPAL